MRINRVTPITPTSLVTLALLGRGDRALTRATRSCVALQNLVAVRAPPRAADDRASSTSTPPTSVQRALDALVESGVVTCFAEGPEPVYAIGPDQHLTAAYYRNTIIHFFVNGAIAELALLRAAEDDVDEPRARRSGTRRMRLRDLLKFEFFFAEKEALPRRARATSSRCTTPSGRTALARGPRGDPARCVRRIRPFNAHRVLRPFLEAYRVVGDALVREKPTRRSTRPPSSARCLALGKQYQLQRRIHSAESVSKVLFETALRLARQSRPARARRRRTSPSAGAAFAEEIRDAIRRIDAIELLAQSRVAGPDPVTPRRSRPVSTRIPVTIVGGFLGSGKTTRVNALLRDPRGRRVAVVLNELGDVGVEAAGSPAPRSSSSSTAAASAAPSTPTSRRRLRRLGERGGFDHLVVETTGIADPLPVAWTFERDGHPRRLPGRRRRSIVADALNLPRLLAEEPDAVLQIERADVAPREQARSRPRRRRPTSRDWSGR